MSTSGTEVLVALDGFCDPDRPVIASELLRTRHWCGRRCSCGDRSRGTGSGGVASAGRVALVTASRSVVVETLGPVIDPDEDGPAAARAAAERLLDAVAAREVGRLVRRDDDGLVPFPPAARIEGRHRIVHRLEAER